MKPRDIIAAYFFVQGFTVFAWWLMLFAVRKSVVWFQPREWPSDALLSFWLADLGLIGLGSVIIAVGVWKELDWAFTAVRCLAAICWYPALFCLASSLKADQAWIATALMVSMAGLSTAMATIQGKTGDDPRAFRVARMSELNLLLATLLQIIVFWGTFLWILPMGIIELEQYLQWERLNHAFQTPMASVLLLLASCLGLWSGFTMVSLGQGTPLPTAAAQRLVVKGPYRFVRNPMALAGIVQGIAVGWLLGSSAVIAYAFVGIFAWHFLVRPLEEKDLMKRFGEDYQRYRNRVRVWIPTIHSPVGDENERMSLR